MLASKQDFGSLTSAKNWALTETQTPCPPQQDGGANQKSKTWNFIARNKENLIDKGKEGKKKQNKAKTWAKQHSPKANNLNVAAHLLPQGGQCPESLWATTAL